jgi:hypothetical protein
MVSSSSIRTGLVKPNSRIDAAIWWICLFECVRAFRGYGLSDAIGRSTMLKVSIGRLLEVE